MGWSEADIERYSGDGQGIELSTSLIDSFTRGVSEGWQASPFNAVRNYLVSKTGDKHMTPLQANEKYGLSNTPYAFKDGDEMVSDEQAQNVLRENLERESNEIALENVQKDYGAIGSVFNFAGNLTAGFLDPINLVGGVGTSMAVAKGVTRFGPQALKAVAAGKNLKHLFAMNLVEEAAFSVVADAALIPMGEEALNRETDLRTRVLNVVGSTVMGGVFGTALQANAVRRANDISSKMLKQYGSKAEEILENSYTHGTMNAANGKQPNPDHIVHMMELGQYRPRPDQAEYTLYDMTMENIGSHEFYVGRNFGEDGFDVISDQGVGTIVLTDNFNYAHNRIHPLDNKVAGEVFATRIGKNAKVMTRDMFEVLKAEVRQGSMRAFDLQANTNKATRSKFLNRVNKELDDATSFGEFKEALDAVFSGDTADVHGIGDIDDFFNKVLHDELGFDGYHTVLDSAMLGDTPHNALVMFKPEVFKAGTKPKKSLYVNPVKTRERRGMVSSTDGSGIFYNGDMFDQPTMVPTSKFDEAHPMAAEYLQPMKDLESAEIKRMGDVKADSDYSQELADVARKAPEANPEQYDTAQDVLESVGATKEQLDPEAYKRGEAEYVLKSDEEIEGNVMKVFEECMRNYGG